jgi:hypothetical protein
MRRTYLSKQIKKEQHITIITAISFGECQLLMICALIPLFGELKRQPILYAGSLPQFRSKILTKKNYYSQKSGLYLQIGSF